VGFGSSSELPGVHRPIGSRRLAASSRPRIGSASPGVLHPYGAYAPRRHHAFASTRDRALAFRLARDPARFDPARPVTRSWWGRGEPPPRPVPPSGFLNPSAVPAAREHTPRLPGSRSPACVTWELRGFFSRRRRPWDSSYRAFPFRRAVPPLDGLLLPCGSTRTRLRRDEREDLTSGFPRAPAPCRVLFALAGSEGATKVSVTRAPPDARPPVHPPLAREAAATVARSRRARRHVARPPASKPCSPRKSVLARTARRADSSLRPNLACRTAPGPLLSWFSAPPELSPPRSRVRSTARRRRASSPTSRKTTPRSGTERGASVLRPRPSEPGGRIRSADPTRHRRTLRASAPPFGRRPFLTSPRPCRVAETARARVGSRGLKAVAVGRSA